MILVIFGFTGCRSDQHASEEPGAIPGDAATYQLRGIVVSSDAAKGIVDVALELGVDLIIISSRHHHWYNRYRPANIADYIVRHAPCPTLEVSDTGESFLSDLDNRAGGPELK